MPRRTATAFALSLLLPTAAFVVIAMRLFGTHRWGVAAALYVAGWICLLIAIAGHRRAAATVGAVRAGLYDALKRNCKFMVTMVLLIVLAYLAVVLFPTRQGDFVDVASSEIAATVDEDFALLPVYLNGIDEAMAAIETDKAIFQGDPSKLSPDQKAHLLQLWSRYLDYSMQIEQLKYIHRHFFQINYIRHPDLNSKSFLIAYTAFTAAYVNTLKLTSIIGDNAYVKTLLNEANAAFDIPSGAYLSLARAATDPGNLARLHAGQANLRFLMASGKLASSDTGPLADRAANDYSDILRRLGNQPALFATTPKDQFEKLTLTAWLPLQKGVAEGMSLVRTTHRENLVKLADLVASTKEFEPGDILLERRNWYLTNIGIPGFWPHTALFTGTPAEMDAYFKDEKLPGGLTVSAYIKQQFPLLYSDLLTKTKGGFDCRVLEAIGPGVVPTALENSGRADYLAVLRPRLSKADKLHALLSAFSFYKRPYDYNFDFLTDAELVCSELVYKAYQPGKDHRGLSFRLVETAGRLLLPPNNIAAKFDAEHGTDAEELDFVLFFDGSEAEKGAFRRDAEAFAKSYKRPKWDVAQQ